MKTILTASLFALASHVAVAGPLYSDTSHRSPSAVEQSHPGNDELIYRGPLWGTREPALTSLDQFERGDPDEMVTTGYFGYAQHQGPAGSAPTSLAQFEQGDPDEMVSAGSIGSSQHHGPTGPVVTSLERFEKGDPDTTPGG
jgi:hypothetical protein